VCCVFGFSSARRRGIPGRSRASKAKGSVGVVFVVTAFVIADEADVDGGEQREDECLDDSDKDFEQAGYGRNDPLGVRDGAQ
jgi:hypothetical protein